MNESKFIFDTANIAGFNPFGGPHATTDIFAPSSSLFNRDNLSFFGTSSYYPSLNSDWNSIEKRVSENAAAQEGTQSTSTISEESRLGLGATSTTEASSGVIDFVKGSASEVEEEAGTAIAEEVAGSSTPWTLAAVVNQQLGEAVNMAQTAQTNEAINTTFTQNMAQHGLNVGLNSSLIRGQQESINQSASAGGSFGALFGPIGALIGHAVAGAVSANPNILNTANSFLGQYNPSDLNAVASSSTASLAGQSNLNVGTTNDSV